MSHAGKKKNLQESGREGSKEGRERKKTLCAEFVFPPLKEQALELGSKPTKCKPK